MREREREKKKKKKKKKKNKEKNPLLQPYNLIQVLGKNRVLIFINPKCKVYR